MSGESLSEIRARLDACAHAIEQALRALPEEAEAAASSSHTLACFTLDGERFALDERWVRGPAHSARPTPLPMGAQACAGMLEVAGEWLPVFDPGVLLGLREQPLSADTLLPVGDERAEFALLADSVERREPPGATHPLPWPLSPDSAELVQGVLTDGTVLLDGARLLLDPRLGIEAQ